MNLFMEHVLRGVEIIGVQDADDIARGHGKALVHGIVDALVGFTDIAHASLETRLILADQIQGAILRGPVDDDVLIILTGLAEDALHGVTEGALTVIGGGDDGYLHFAVRLLRISS